MLHKHLQAENCFILYIYQYVNTLCLSFCIIKANQFRIKQNYITEELQLVNSTSQRLGNITS